MTLEKVTIAIADDYQDRFAEVVGRCQAVGLTVEERLTGIGVISGIIDSAARPQLSQVAGVAAVEPVRTFQLPPPESEIQ